MLQQKQNDVQEGWATSPAYNKSQDSRKDGFGTDFKRKGTVFLEEQEEDMSYLRRLLITRSASAHTFSNKTSLLD